MKLIHKFKSPNFNKRQSKKIKYLIIHYTALKDYSESLKYLCDKSKKVSSHYLISQQGDVYNLVSEKMRAWHAGISYWKSDTDINSASIGIELDYSPNHKNNIFKKKMIKSLINLIKMLKKKYNIHNSNILGHSDISPYRKLDPGPKFPWKKLAKFDLIYFPVTKKNKKQLNLEAWFKKNKLTRKKNIALFMLGYIGYDMSLSIKNSNFFQYLIKSYQYHYFPNNISCKLDNETYDLIFSQFTNLLLTSSKK